MVINSNTTLDEVIWEVCSRTDYHPTQLTFYHQGRQLQARNSVGTTKNMKDLEIPYDSSHMCIYDYINIII